MRQSLIDLRPQAPLRRVICSSEGNVTSDRHGVSCDHCAASVMEEVQRVGGVRAVVVGLEAGRVAVRGRGLSEEAVRGAVDEAGFGVVGA